MRAVVVGAPDVLEVRDVSDPRDDGRAVVRVETAGICGTDVKILRGAIPVHYPRVLGHEIVGTVVAAGSGGRVAEGTRVVVDPGVTCGRCDLCLADNGHLCRNGALLGRDADGGFSQLFAVEDRQLHPLPDHLGWPEAAVLQVLATCVHAQTLVPAFPGQVAVVVGLGVAGLLHVQLLRNRGIDSVVGVTRSAGKRAAAEVVGATVAVAPDEAEQAVSELSQGRGADLVVEAAGRVATLRQAIELAGLGARLLVFGTITETSGELPFYQLYYRELDVVNARAARPRDYALAVDLVAAGRIQAGPLATASFPLEQAREAFGALDDPGQLKVTFEVA